MSQDWDPWAEVVRPILSTLVCNLKPSHRMLDHLHARKLICDSEMETLTDLLDESERSHTLLKYLSRRKADFLPFCDVLLAMDDESQKQIGQCLRDALASRRGPQLEDSPSPRGFGQLQLETRSTGQFQGITSSKKSKMGDHVTLFVPQATGEFKSTGVATPINVVEHAMSSTMVISNCEKVEFNINATPPLTLPSGRDQLSEGYRPCVDEQFVGRDDLIKSLTEKLKGSQNTIVVSGPPGMGKTSVANAVCLEYRSHEGIGPCYWIQLHDVVTTVDDVHMLCCQWVTDTISHTHDIKSLSKRIFRVLPSNSVIVVDACEKATPCIISNFLCDANAVTNWQLRFLLTSQVAMNKHQLRVPSLHEVRLTPLSKEDSLKILKYEKETLSEDALTDMKTIGDLLHGVPLALSLASTMFRYLEYTPHTLLAKLQTEGVSSALSSDSDELGKGIRTVLVEFFALIREKGGARVHRAAIFASIFPGTVSQEAFDHVCDVSLEGGTPQVVGATASVNPKLIASLTKWHVLERCRGIDESNPRYQMHAYIKEYAARVLNDRKTPDLSKTVKELFLMYFSKLLKHIAKEEETRQSLKDTGGLFALDRELENISGFLTLLTDGQTLRQCEAAAPLVLEALTNAEVGHLLSLRFPHDKRLNTLRYVYKSVKTVASAQIKAGLKLEMAIVLRGLGRFDEALEDVRQAHQFCVEDRTDELREAHCQEVMGSIEFRQHRSGFVNAEKSLKTALKLARENFNAAEKCQKNDNVKKWNRRLASVCKTLGELYSRQGKSDEAIALFQEAKLRYCQSTGTEVLSNAWLMHRIGNHYQTEHQFDKAERAFKEGLDLCKKYRAEKQAVHVKLNYSLGRLYQYHDWKDLPKSLMHYEKARSLQEDLNPDHPDLVQIYIGIGRVHNEMESDSEKTLELFKKARDLLEYRPRKHGQSDFTMAELCIAEALTYRLLGKYENELASLKQAREIYDHSSEVGESINGKKANLMSDLGNAHRRLGNQKEMASCFAQRRRLMPKGKGRKR